MCVCQVILVTYDSATLWTVAHRAPLSMDFSRQEYWSRLPCPPPGDLPNPGIKLASLTSPALAGGFFTTPPEKPPFSLHKKQKILQTFQTHYNSWRLWVWSLGTARGFKFMLLQQPRNQQTAIATTQHLGCCRKPLLFRSCPALTWFVLIHGNRGFLLCKLVSVSTAAAGWIDSASLCLLYLAWVPLLGTTKITSQTFQQRESESMAFSLSVPCNMVRGD